MVMLRVHPALRSSMCAAAILAACAGAPVHGSLPPVPAPRAPLDARAQALALSDPATAAEIAWVEASDRALARARLDEGLTASPGDVSLLIRRALLSQSELDPVGALNDLLAIIEHAPGRPEAALALLLISENLDALVADRDRIRQALSNGGEKLHGHVHATLRSDLLTRLAALDRRRQDIPAGLEDGGWLTDFKVLGPIAPPRPGSLRDPSIHEIQGLGVPVQPFLGRIPRLRSARSWRMQVTPSAGSASGLFVLESFVRIERKAAELVLETHLTAPARVRIDGEVAVERPMMESRGARLARTPIRLSPGWHRITVSIVASPSTRFALSILASDGSRAIAEVKDELPASASLESGRPQLGAAVDIEPLTSGYDQIVAELVADPDRTLFGRALGAMIATSRWVDDLPRAQELLHGALGSAPRSSLLLTCESVVSRRSNAPEGAVEAKLRDALASDPEHPALLVAVAKHMAGDSPDAALPLLHKAASVAPRAPEPHAVRFGILSRREWHAEALESLRNALERRPSVDLLSAGAGLLRRLQRIAEAEAMERQLLELVDPFPEIEQAKQAELRGDVDSAIGLLEASWSRLPQPAAQLVHIAELWFARGELDRATKAATTALGEDPHNSSAMLMLVRVHLRRADLPAAKRFLHDLEFTNLEGPRVEALLAELEGRAPGEPTEGSPLEKALSFDPWPSVASSSLDSPPPGMDPADRWAGHRMVQVLDRVVDFVEVDGHSTSLRHSIRRLQTKDAADQAGELALPAEALPIAIRTLKPDRRTIEVDRHAGKSDLSFSAIAPGDAVEYKWIESQGPSTPWGGYLQSFYFQGPSPTVRADFAVAFPRSMRIWTKSYNGAPEAQVWTEGERVVYFWRAENVLPLEVEPRSAPADEYLPFVVVAADLEPADARRANLVSIDNLVRKSHAMSALAQELTRDINDPEQKARRIFAWITTEIGQGNGRDPDVVLATRRGDRTGLFISMLRDLGLAAEATLARSGASAIVTPRYPHPGWFSTPLVRIRLDRGRTLWASLAGNHPWLGDAPPAFAGGEYLQGGDVPKVLRFTADEIAKWPLLSKVDLVVDAQGTARGSLSLSLPGTHGAELRDFFAKARRDDLEQAIQGWLSLHFPGASIESLESEHERELLEPFELHTRFTVENFMSVDGDYLVAERFFNEPLAQSAIGIPPLLAYLQLPARRTPLLVAAATETMIVSVRLPQSSGAPVEWPRGFEKHFAFGDFSQSVSFDGKTSTLLMQRTQSTPLTRIPSAEFPAFREAAQELIQLTRNRLIVPLAAAKAKPTTAAAAP